MILSKQISRNSMKHIKICSLIGLSTLLITGSLIPNKLYATDIASTSISELTNTMQREVPTGYVKPEYKFIIADSLDKEAIANELPAADAAEIVSQEIYRYLKVNISEKTIELRRTHPKDSDDFYWSGIIQMDSLNKVAVIIDRVTGEFYSIDRKILIPITPGMVKASDRDADDIKKPFKNNTDAICKKVNDLLVSLGCFPEKIKSVTYVSSTGGTYYTGPAGKEQPLGDYYEHRLNVTTESGKVYEVIAPFELTRIDSIKTPTSIAQREAHIAHRSAVNATKSK